ncbi:hypothetical protein [Arthrobacter castelli]|uniref:hypothetical protein n=1 Tax=Arthrobacter castelli TaxID=271431 RepID=UPI00047EAD10|nr:hypothetical protein [Arthrobacter castelli]
MKRRSIVILSTAAGLALLLVLGLVMWALNQQSTSALFSSFGRDHGVILLDEAGDFKEAVGFQIPEMEGWHSRGADAIANPASRCTYTVNEFTGESGPEYLSDDGSSTTAKMLARLKKEFARSLPGPESIIEAENVVIPQQSNSAPGLEFKVARMDYVVPGTATSGTMRIAGRNMPQSDNALWVLLICPTDIVEGGSDPWPDLIANTVVTPYEKPDPFAD